MSELREDELEKQVDAAVKAAYRDGPEWLEVRRAVELLKADRRQRMAPSIDQFADALGREAERAATALEQEAARIGEATKGFVGDMKSALERFRKKT